MRQDLFKEKLDDQAQLADKSPHLNNAASGQDIFVSRLSPIHECLVNKTQSDANSEQAQGFPSRADMCDKP